MGIRSDVRSLWKAKAKENTHYYARYLKCIDRFYNNYVSCFITPGSTFIFSFYKQYLINSIRYEVPLTPFAGRSNRYINLIQSLNIHRRQSNISTNRRSHSTVLYRSVRTLGQDYHEPVLSSQHGSQEPNLSQQGHCFSKEVPVMTSGIQRESSSLSSSS